jgi:predicted AAA+ superfamily ATPase
LKETSIEMSEFVVHKRQNYLDAMEPWIGKPVIKILTGMRRVGKSMLLEQVRELLLGRGVEAWRIVVLNMERLEFEAIKDHRDLARHIGESTVGLDGAKYLLIDEVQEIAGWEKAVNSLFSEGHWDIYLTGSNAHMLSAELATLLAGRYVEFPVYSLSLTEYLDFKGLGKGDAREVFPEYLRLGGMPAIHQFGLHEPTVMQYLGSIFDTIVLKDIVARHELRNVPLFENICRFVIDNIGSLISARRIAEYLKAQRLSVSVDTVLKYLGYLEETFILHRARRYDVRGKRHLEINDKYYLGDIGLRHARLGHAPSAINGLLENLVFLELKRRGYQVFVGKVGDREVDFVATRDRSVRYLQVCYLLADDAVVEREFGVLRSIPDHYPKLVVSADTLWSGDQQGIGHCHIADFLALQNP